MQSHELQTHTHTARQPEKGKRTHAPEASSTSTASGGKSEFARSVRALPRRHSRRHKHMPFVCANAIGQHCRLSTPFEVKQKTNVTYRFEKNVNAFIEFPPSPRVCHMPAVERKAVPSDAVLSLTSRSRTCR